ncbi:DNA-3-methyladenine glycosylase [Alcaligenaceae bacterium 429]|uniref:DNA-3-methyladenine glycosylase n=1 Tax=Paenalcaligenes sp. Me52 TaxID=3392038 RepID=UPI001091F7C5|nr:DNA-3-methyladenine glycosylase [Alcaligenaceae bacterium 429]
MPISSTALPRDFYLQDTIEVAQQLLGHYLVYEHAGQTRYGRIVETEAYLGAHDLAAHSCRGVTPRTQIMFGPGGFAYVYLIYGMHHCFNIVTGPEGQGSAVLIRALEPLGELDTNTAGPGRLCKAMGITREQNGYDLCNSALYVCHPDSALIHANETLVTAPRIGVDYAGEWALKPLRFLLQGNAYVSRPAPKTA